MIQDTNHFGKLLANEMGKNVISHLKLDLDVDQVLNTTIKCQRSSKIQDPQI